MMELGDPGSLGGCPQGSSETEWRRTGCRFPCPVVPAPGGSLVGGEHPLCACRAAAGAAVSAQSLGHLPRDGSSGISEALGGGGMKHPRRCQPAGERSRDAVRGSSGCRDGGKDQARRWQAGSRLLARRQARGHSASLQPAPGGAGQSADVLSPPDPHASPGHRQPAAAGAAGSGGSTTSWAGLARRGDPQRYLVLQPGWGSISAWAGANTSQTSPAGGPWIRVCVLVCVLESLLLGGFQALQAESTNLCLIKMALCNITYMSLHLTPMVPRKAQAPFQPPGCVPPGQISQGHGTVGQELGCVSVRILPPSREAQWGFA